MQIVPMCFNSMQRHALSCVTGRDLYLKSRQLGCTSWIQSLIHPEITLQTGSAITLSDTSENTKKIRAIYNRFHEQWPDDMLEMRPLRAKDSEAVISYPLVDSESVISTAGAKTAGRSGTYSHVHGSEVAFWQNANTVLAGVLQAATPTSAIMLESTPNGAQGAFYELCMQAAQGNGLWTLHFYPWWWGEEYATQLESGETIEPTPEEAEVIRKAALGGFALTPEQLKWRRQKQLEPGMALLFLQEYPEDINTCFLSSGLSVFDNFEDCLRKSTQDEPDEKHRYVGGVDWGQTDDYTALSIIDATTNEEVYVNRWRRITPEQVIVRILDAARQWRVESLLVERNSMGWNYFYSLVVAIEQADGLDISVSWFVTTNESKRNMADSLGRAMRGGVLTLLFTDDNGTDYGTSELRTFVQSQTANGVYTYGHISGAKDDSVIARMAGWDAAGNLIY